jgi:mRNA-degrading endonuclease RelE of RelBE toxin-antitoxin system
MHDDPMRGDVLPLKGRQWQGRYRKRVGRYRIIFSLDHTDRIVEVSAILLRDEHTYR